MSGSNWSVTMPATGGFSGVTYTQDSFAPYQYAVTWPTLMSDLRVAVMSAVNVPAQVQAAADSAAAAMLRAAEAAQASQQAQTAVASVTVGSTASLAYPEAVASLLTATDVVDVFIYDTRQDSDGGAWTEQCSGTSWWQEALGTATRGLKRAFPKVALLVARNVIGAASSTLTIYDAMDHDATGAPRMWMVFPASANQLLRATGTMGTNNAFTRVSALNGRVWVGQGLAGGAGVGCLNEINFPGDTAGYATTSRFRFPGGIVDRSITTNTTWATIPVAGPTIVERNVFDVHARVLPGAPLDPVSGLPIPTVAVATAGGISVIHPNDVVASLTGESVAAAIITPDGRLRYSNGPGSGSGTTYGVGPLPYAASTFSAWRGWTHAPSMTAGNGVPRFNATPVLAEDGSAGIAGAGDGLLLWAEEVTNGMAAMSARVATDFATGWMPGDTRLAALCRGMTGSAVASGNLITNGDFSAGSTDWTPNAGVTFPGEFARLSSIAGSQTARLGRTVTGLTVGEAYTIEVEITANTGHSPTIAASPSSQLGSEAGSRPLPGGTLGRHFLSFVATAATMHFQVFLNSGSTHTVDVDNISLRPAAMDHSARRNGLTINGTLPRTAVAAGADLAAWSGWSASNYLEQPYNPNLDFGTGDFMFAAWVRTTSAGNETLIWRQDIAAAGERIGLDINNGAPRIVTNGATPSGTASTANDGAWHLLVGLRRSGVLEVWMDGVRQAAATHLSSLTNTNAVTRIGVRSDGTTAAAAGTSISLLRIAAYAPTPAQIARMYRDERALFQPSAAAFLGGTSNAVRKLSRSRFSGRLAVATGGGVSIFAGLRRVEYHSTATAGASMASNDVRAVAMEGGVLAIGTAANAGARRGAIIGLDRLPGNASGATPTRVMRAAGVTSNATPLVLSPRLFVAERETLTVLATFVGRVVGASDGQRIVYRRRATFFRDAGGNVTLQGAVEALGTDTEVTSTADGTLVVDTASQTVAAQVTGVATTSIAWTVRFDVERNSEDARYEECDA